ncbi:MAG: HPr family phosphocarrier protein [Desulfovibrio sp.]|jgi:phosphocarrier protein|nr:HPr family phosphocarrier protein [Desulfovibrio sp.]
MFRETLTVKNPSGLHARPASMLTQLCRKFESDIAIIAGGKTINPKSVVSLLSAGVKPGTEIELRITGPDEDRAGAGISELINNLSE